MKCSRVGIHKFLIKYKATGSISKVGSGRPSRVMAEIKEIVEEQMRADDETTACQLHLQCCHQKIFKDGWSDVSTIIMRLLFIIMTLYFKENGNINIL